MKKILPMAGLIILLLTSAACSNNTNNNQEEVSNVTVNGTEITANTQIEAIVSAEIEGPISMKIGADADTAAANEYSVKLIGEKGSIITASNLDKQVTDFNISWEIDGFKTENDISENSYCDYYGSFEIKNTNDVKAVFNLRKNVSMNFFGKMTATITYNGQQITAYKYVTAINNTDIQDNQILPVGGFISDFNEYPNSMIGYKSADDSEKILGGWSMTGTDEGKMAVLENDKDGKFMKVTAATADKSHMFVNKIDTPSSQVIFEQEVRFNNSNAVISFKDEQNVAVAIEYNAATITLNGNPVDNNGKSVEYKTDTWYKIVFSADKTTEKAFAKVYDLNGILLGEVNDVKWINSCSPIYYTIGISDKSIGSVDFNNYKVYYPKADENKSSLTAKDNSLSISGNKTTEITAELKTEEGYEITGKAVWTVVEDNMKDGITIVADSSNSHKAVVAISDRVPSGTATIQVNIGGYVKTVKLNITGTENSNSVSTTNDNSAFAANADIMSFNFGENSSLAGYINVTPESAYTEEKGYGITGNPTAGGTSSGDINSDYLEGKMAFVAKVEPAKLYKVEITYQGELKAEPVNSELTAYTLGSQNTLKKAEYIVPVMDETLELSIASYKDNDTTITPQIASIVITKQAEKEAGEKPSYFAIGDSTLSNNGSWAYYITHNTSEFSDLYELVNFESRGRGGSSLQKYYVNGDFRNVLLSIKPGDIVSLGNMGTNGGVTSKYIENFNYYLDCFEALGAKVIINSYTPHGAVGKYAKYYNSETQVFTSYRTDKYDQIARQIAEERSQNDPDYLGFVDIGNLADAAFNAYVDDYAANSYESRDAAGQAIIACFKDHNHYEGLASVLIDKGYTSADEKIDADGTVDRIIEVITPYINELKNK